MPQGRKQLRLSGFTTSARATPLVSAYTTLQWVSVCVRERVRERASKYVIAGPVTSMCDADLWWLWACVAAY